MRLAPTASAILLAAAGAGAGCSSAEPSPPLAAAPTRAAPPAAVAAAAEPGLERPRLVFFMNPGGVPCQVQDGILRGMRDLPGHAELVYFRTTEQNDLGQFARYGIRSLPALVLTDATGRELRRATPGIQSEAQVRALLGP
jgi:thioredoxin 1